MLDMWFFWGVRRRSYSDFPDIMKKGLLFFFICIK